MVSDIEALRERVAAAHDLLLNPIDGPTGDLYDAAPFVSSTLATALALVERMATERDKGVEEIAVFRREITARYERRKDTHGFEPDAFTDLPPDEQAAKLRTLLAKTAAELDDCYEAHSQMASEATRAWLDATTTQESLDEARAELTAIRAALGNGADEAAWRPGETMAEAVGRLRGEHHSLRDVLQWVNDQCPGKCSAVCDSALRAGHEGPHAEALAAGNDGEDNGA